MANSVIIRENTHWASGHVIGTNWDVVENDHNGEAVKHFWQADGDTLADTIHWAESEGYEVLTDVQHHNVVADELIVQLCGWTVIES